MFIKKYSIIIIINIKEIIMKEIWKPIKNYEDLYEISNLGRVKSLLGWNGKKVYKKRKNISCK